MKPIFVLLLLVLLLSAVIFVCDWGYKHLLWRFVSQRTAVFIRWGTAIVLALLVVGMFHYGHRYTRYEVEVKPVRVVSERVPKGFEGFRIAHISDLHLNTLNDARGKAFLREAFDSIVAQRPDIICFTGDLVSFSSQEAEPFREELSYLAAHGIPVYSVLGNHDYADYTGQDKAWRKADTQRLIQWQREYGWTVLNNAHLDIARGADTLRLVGVENIGEPPFSTYGHLRKAMGGYEAAERCFTLLLSHNPTHWRREVLPNTQIDLTLSGHTHAMQFRVLGWSPVSWRYKEWGGLYSEGEQHLYVNTGLGCIGNPSRVGVRPEVTILTLSRLP